MLNSAIMAKDARLKALKAIEEIKGRELHNVYVNISERSNAGFYYVTMYLEYNETLDQLKRDGYVVTLDKKTPTVYLITWEEACQKEI